MDIKLSHNQRLRLAGSLAVLLAAGGLWLFVRPGWDLYQERHGELSNLMDQMPPERPRLMPLGLLIRRITETRAALDAQRGRFPITENVSQLLIEMEKILSGTEITRFYPTKLDDVPLAGLASADVRVLRQRVLVDAEGSFFALRNFLERLEGFRHPVQVRDFEISYPKDSDIKDPDRLAMTMTLAAYLLERPLGGAESERRVLDEILAEIEAAEPEPVEVAGPPPLPPYALVEPRSGPDAIVLRAPPVVTDMPTPPPPPPRDLDTTPQDWTVIGIVYARESRTAVLESGTRQMAVAAGDEIENGWVVHRIDPRRVLVRKGRRTQVLGYPADDR